MRLLIILALVAFAMAHVSNRGRFSGSLRKFMNKGRQMSGRPTGRPSRWGMQNDFWAKMKEKIAAWRQSLTAADDDTADETNDHGDHSRQSMGMRPTGRPMGGHPMGGHPMGGHPMGGHPMGGHPMGMRPTGRPMGMKPMGGMDSDFWKHMKDMVAAWKQKKAAAAAAGTDADETQMMGGMMGRHPRRPQHPMGRRPTGRPMGGRPMNMGPRPSGRPMRGQKGGMDNEFWSHLKDMVAAWKKSKATLAALDDDTDETQAQGDKKGRKPMRPMGGQMNGKRPTGRPMKGQRPMGGKRPNGQRQGNMGANQMSGMDSEFWSHLKEMVAAWKKSKAAAATADETAIWYKPFSKHFDNYKKGMAKFMTNRPTGRPDRVSVLKNIHNKFQETLKKLQSARPTGRPLSESKKSYGSWLSKLKAYYQKMKTQAKQ